ncbi:peptidylprolyl isomerase [Defluviimonas sp. WL0024]|uniref:Parvulin-like PPIase n=1 Tax=Albidovulum salinarum TaxID=2984153 RepID=A0ABT2X3P8_9RHOB|nr:peptidylprolyl isomerase [Defluviimonas sp. WL0024]MCU9846475.1 peptidylprolyl isomerase [Defluviimonas sp. WL0024]
MRFPFLLSLALAAATTTALPAMAQGSRFSTAVIVNDSAVTQYELEQRIRFLQLLRAPGDPAVEAEKGLIDDRLRSQAAEAAEITLTEEQIAAGMTEFAARANLSAEEFVTAIGQGGVAPETFRDFVSSGLAWREAVRARYAKQIVISDAEIDRALSVEAGRGAGPRVLLSEILLPVRPDTSFEIRRLATELSETIRSEGDFARAARAHSAAPSRDRGGQIGWIPLTNLPAQIRPAVAGLAQGQVSPPIPLGDAMAIFRMRGTSEGGEIKPANITVDYAQYLIPGAGTADAQAEAARIRAKADTCDDLYRVLRGAPATQLIRETRPLGQVPADIASVLAGLDENEVSTALTRGNAQVFLMLCDRDATLAEGGAPVVDPAAIAPEGAPAIDPELGFGAGPSRAQIREELTNQRLGNLADGYLAELRSAAIIHRP